MAAMTADELAVALARVRDEVSRELATDADARSQGMVTRDGQSPLVVVDDSAGDSLWDALSAVEASARLQKSTLKSLGHALAALEYFVGALRELKPAMSLREQWSKVIGWLLVGSSP